MTPVFRAPRFLLFGVLLVPLVSSASVQDCDPCSDCPDALVRLTPEGEIEGDIPSDMARTLDGRVETGYVFNQMLRGFDFLELEARHPCADLYYILPSSHPAMRDVRVGHPLGTARYEIRTTITISQEPGQAVVMREAGGRVGPAVVPSRGTVEAEHQLIALKNGETYDTGREITDWVPDPPPGESYYRCDETVTVGGQVYEPASGGLILGELSAPLVLVGWSIPFDQGDIGVTIRRKETPSALNVDIDTESLFRDFYKLKLNGIRNHFGETLPDNVRIALQCERGTIQGGRDLQGWKVFTTKGGQVPRDIIYEPPDCTEATEDTLRISAVCDFHDGSPSVCRRHLDYSIPLIRCFGVSAMLTAEHEETMEAEEREFGVARLQGKEAGQRVNLFLNFGDEPSQKTRYPVPIYTYRLQSISVSSSFGRGTSYSHVYSHSRDERSDSEVHVISMKPETDDGYLVIFLDSETNRIQKVRLALPALRLEWRGEQSIRKQWKSEDQSGWEKEAYTLPNDWKTSWHIVLDSEACEQVRAGDGEHFASGRCEETITRRFSEDRSKLVWRLYIR